MADRQETIADIIAWLRKPREGENAYLTLWRDEIADRLEAAWKREREVTKPAENVNSVAASDTAGNCAKLREALAEARRFVWTSAHRTDRDLLVTDDGKRGPYVLTPKETLIKIDAALSAPPRNCDIAQDWLRDLYVKFKPPASVKREMPPEWVDSVMAFCRWLVAPATEQKGGIIRQ